MIETLLFIIVLFIFLLLWAWPISVPILIYCIIRKRKNKQQFKNSLIYKNNGRNYFNDIKDTYIDIDEYKLKHFDTNDLGALKNYFGNLFLEFEKAYNNVDYNTLYNICTRSLYNLYRSDLDVKTKLLQKKTIDNVVINKMVIYNSTKNEDEHKVYVMIAIDSINYLQNSNGKIIAGNAVNKIHEEFIITYVKQLKKDEKSSRCPNCGAMINSTKCDYCNTEFKEYDFRICSINKLV